MSGRPRLMTAAELAAWRDVESAEQALVDAVSAREVARERFDTVTHRANLRAHARAHLRIVSSPDPWDPAA